MYSGKLNFEFDQFRRNILIIRAENVAVRMRRKCRSSGVYIKGKNSVELLLIWMSEYSCGSFAFETEVLGAFTEKIIPRHLPENLQRRPRNFHLHPAIKWEEDKELCGTSGILNLGY